MLSSGISRSVCNGDSLPTFRDNLSVPSSWVSVRNYHYTLRNIAEERTSHLLVFPGGSLKSRIVIGCFEKMSSDSCVDWRKEYHKNTTFRTFVLA